MPYCQYCGKEMPEGVDSCPECGKSIKTTEFSIKTTSTKKPSNAWYLIILLGWIGSIIGYLALRNRNKSMANQIAVIGLFIGVFWIPLFYSSPTPETLTDQQNLITTPTTAPTLEHDVVIKFTEEFVDEISWNTPKEGHVFLIITLEVENKVDKEFHLYPYNFKVIVDGVEYDRDAATYSLENELESVDLHKGGKISGQIAYEIPEDTSEYTIIYETLFSRYDIEWIHY